MRVTILEPTVPKIMELGAGTLFTAEWLNKIRLCLKTASDMSPVIVVESGEPIPKTHNFYKRKIEQIVKRVILEA